MWPNSCERVTCSQETADLAVSSATTRSLLYSHEPSYEWEYAQQRTKLWNFKYDFISNVRFEWNKSMFLLQVKEGLTKQGMESQFFNCEFEESGRAKNWAADEPDLDLVREPANHLGHRSAAFWQMFSNPTVTTQQANKCTSNLSGICFWHNQTMIFWPGRPKLICTLRQHRIHGHPRTYVCALV